MYIITATTTTTKTILNLLLGGQ